MQLSVQIFHLPILTSHCCSSWVSNCFSHFSSLTTLQLVTVVLVHCWSW